MDDLTRWFFLVMLAGGLVISACGNEYEADDDSAGDDDTGDDDTGDDDTNTLDDPSISAVTPSSGNLTGGYAINIYGANFTTTEDTEIYFDDVLTNLQGCGPAQCTILAPQWDTQELVSVRLVNSGGEALLEGGFSYVEDMSALTSYYSAITRWEYKYPDIYNPPATNEVTATAGFFSPQNVDILEELFWGDLLPDTGECDVVNVEDDWDSISVDAMHAGDSVTLVGPTAELVLPKDPGIMGWEYNLEGLDIYTDWEAGDYMLQIPGGDDLGPEQVNNAVTCPAPITTNLVLDYSQYTSMATFQQGLSFEVTGECDGVVLRADMFFEGDPYLIYDRTVMCHFPDSGVLQMDSAATSQFSTNLAAIVTLDCYKKNQSIIASGAGMTGLGRIITHGILVFN